MPLSFANIGRICYINPAHFSKIALAMRCYVCLHFVHIQNTLQNAPEMCDSVS